MHFECGRCRIVVGKETMMRANINRSLLTACAGMPSQVDAELQKENCYTAWNSL